MPSIVLNGFDGNSFVIDGFYSSGNHQLIDQGLETYLSTQLNCPIYPNHIPQSVTTYPVITYTLIYQEPYYTLLTNAGLVAADFQIDVWGNDALQVELLNDSLRSSLEGYRGNMGQVPVRNVRYVDGFQDSENYPDDSDSWVYRIESEWRIWYAESVLD